MRGRLANFSARNLAARPLTTTRMSWPFVSRFSRMTRLRVACPIPSPTTPYRIRMKTPESFGRRSVFGGLVRTENIFAADVPPRSNA
jgi:hypothetical protein